MNKSIKTGKARVTECMVRYLAHKEGLPQDSPTGNSSGTEGTKASLTRRECVKLGVTTAAAGLVASTGLVSASSGQDEEPTTFATDFSEYSL